MAMCHDMQIGDIYYCEQCGLELRVQKPCTCKPGEGCSVPLSCCGKEMVKTSR
jgi:hypothetical protein